eukprot:TRINITY_DN1370_c0_g2_i1.p1 TRINITY_DN1370_c0_g2~~TRINITY_DN1370_c0_g2_i1.p1  ORF type:complete len:631 (+),score=220.98 TRINITY_DN1370_c0_g2_i1:244-2136(+)
MSGDPEKDKREEERLLRAMQKKAQGPKTSVFAKTTSTDFKKQKEEEEKKKKLAEEEKAKKQREDAERRKKIEADEQQRKREAELEQQRHREAEERERAEKAAAAASSSSASDEPQAIDAATEKVLSKEEQRLRRVVSGKQEAAKPKESGLQAHLRLLQEKQQKIEEHHEPAPTQVRSQPAPSQPAHQEHHAVQPQAHAQPQTHTQPPAQPARPSHAAPNVSESTDFPAPGPASICGSFELEVLAQLNEVRRNPAAYANYLKTLEGNYDGNVFSVPDSRYVRQTKEGVSALHNAIAFLHAQQPVPDLQMSELLSKVSKDLVEEEGRGVQQSSQNAAYERFSRYGRWEGEMAEMISYGGISAKEVVLQWLVDDGDRERRDQRSIVQPHFRIVGLSSGHHPEYGRICVATLTHEYNDLKDVPKEATTAAANVSLIKEEEGKVLINGGSAPGNKSSYKLLKRGKRLTLLSSDVNRSWDLPFDFQAAGVRATIDAHSNLTIQITKASDNAEDNGAVLVSSFPLGAHAGSGPKIQLAVRQDPECIYVDINPSSYEEEVNVKTKGNSVEVESKHTEIEEVNDQTYKKVITSVQTLQLPFKPTELVVEHKVAGKPCVVINKKIASTPRSVQEEEIPIF